LNVAVVFEARMAPEQVARLAELMREHLSTRPEGVVTAALLVEGEDAQLIAFWRDRDTLDRYLASVDEPRGAELMREAGAVATWRIVEVPQLG
jgi:hypothetical protein